MEVKKENKGITKDDVMKNLPQFLNEWQEQVIKRKTPDQFVKWRVGPGGLQLAYIEVSYIIDILNLAFGGDWDFQIIDKDIGKKQIWVMGRLTIRLSGRVIVKENFGSSSIKFSKGSQEVIDLGNDLKAASSDALKKCASMLGIASDVYSGKATHSHDGPVTTYTPEPEYTEEKYREETRDDFAKSLEEMEPNESAVPVKRSLVDEYNNCPECSKGHIIKKSGRYGDFEGCDRYPDCKYIVPHKGSWEQKKTGPVS
jgi:hypothetical protein